MPTKKILSDEESRNAILSGVNAIANVVGVSLGPKGRTVVIGRRNNSEITKDGVTIARSVNLEDPIECIGANMVKEVSQKTVILAGDGTTTAMVLAQSILQEGFKRVAAGSNPIELKKGIDKSVIAIVGHIKSIAKSISIDSEELKQIATISANNDEFIGGHVSAIFRQTGIGGIVGIERSLTYETHTKLEEGLQINTGYIAPHFMNDLANQTCQLEDAYILVCEGKISTHKEIFTILDKVIGESKHLLIIAEDIEGEAFHTLMANRMKAKYKGAEGYPLCVIKAPGFGDAKKDFIKDIAIVVGANVVNDATGLRIDQMKISDLGKANKILVAKDETTILGGGGEKMDVDAQVAYVRKASELAKSDYERAVYDSRIAKLTGGLGIIYIGAATDIEYKELAARYDDALRATKAAVEEGIVPGGGVSLLRCIDVLENLSYDSEDEKAGIKMMQTVLEAPFKKMEANAGRIKVSISDVKKSEGNIGYNFKTDVLEDLIVAGVIDPAKVIRVALTNAASVTGTLLTSEALIVNEDDPMPNMQQQRR